MGEIKKFEKPDEILLYLKNERAKSVQEISKYTGLEEREIRKILSILKKMGLLKESKNLTPLGSRLLGLQNQTGEEG